MKIDLLAVYEKKKPGKIKFDYDKKSKERPAWIRLTEYKVKPGFLRIRINNLAEIPYRAFGNYFYPLDATPKEKKKFMAKISRDYDSIVAKNNAPWAQKIAERLEKSGLKKDARIIDLGAGTGIASEAMVDRGYKNLTLVDCSSEMLAIAETKSKLSKTKFIVADVEKLDLKERYDAAISIMLFCSIKPESKLEKVLKRIKSVMNPDAFIAIVDDSKKAVYSKLFEKIEDGIVKASTASETTRYYFLGRKV